jgi:cysteine desulfurase family protein (TIGR01976 family)
MALDVAFVRSQFPAFQAAQTRDWIFFENAGGSYVPATVIDRLQRFFVEHKVQPYGTFALSQRAGEEMDESYEAVAQLLNADMDEITIGPSTTLNLYILAQSLRHLLRPGDEVVVTNQDHEANVGCWRRLSEHGVLMREWRVGKADGELDITGLENLISDRTKLVCCTLCSNLVGTHNNMNAISEMAHKVGALVVADGVSYAPHVIPDVQTLGADFYAYSTYKTFGSHQGVLWGSKNALRQTEGQGHFFNEEKSRYRLNPTGPQHAQIAALAGITEYFNALYGHHFGDATGSLHERAAKVFELVSEHEARLANILLDYLKNKPDIRLLGQDHAEAGKRASTIAFHARAMPSTDIAQKLAEHHIGVGSGHFYALRCVEALGMDPEDGVVRVSMVHYNTVEEVQKLIGALDTILAGEG